MTPPLFSFGRRRRAATRSRDEREDLRDGTPAPAPPEAVAEIAPAPPPTVAPVDEVARGEELARSVSSELVEKALERWRQDLLDLGGAASLDDLAALDDVVDLTAAHPSGIAQLYAGRPTHLSSLVRERNALSVVRQSLREVAGRTDALARQFGVAPVYLAIGVATWTEPLDPSDEAYAEQMAALIDAGPAGDQEADGIPVGARGDLPTVPTPMVPTRTIHAPVLLRPVHLASTSSEASLTLAPSIEVNPVLTRALREAGSRADVEAIARATMTASGFTPSAAITSIGALGREHLTSFEISERLVVGAFVHPGQALVDDFDATVERARASALVAALAGDESGRTALDVALDPPDGLDRAPELERGAGDLDVGQHDAVEAVSSGACLLLDAPPGSDVAATLAAVIADAAGSGRTVLHVPATSADGHAVADALRELGLEGMILDLTEDPAWRRNAGEQIKLSLGAQPPELDVAGILDLRDRLAALRGRLSASVTALHERRRPWGASAYEALQQLAEFTTGRSRTRTSVRINPFHLEQLDEGGRQRARVLLRRAYHLGMLSPDSSSSAWSELSLDDVDEATDALARLARLADELLPRVRAHAEDAASQTGMRRAASLDQWCDQLEMLDGVRESLDVFKPEVFERSAADMVIATATRQWRDVRALEMSASDRRRFTRQAKDLVRPGRMVHDLHAELVKAQQRRENWRVHDPEGGWPSLPRGLDEMQAAADQAREAVLALQPIIASKPDAPVLIDMPMEALEDLANSLADDDEAAQKIPEVNRVSDELARMGLTELVEDLAARRVAVDDIEPEFDYCWWASLLGRLLREDPALKGLESGLLAERTAELAELDAAQVATLAGPVAQAWARRVRAAVDQDKESARSLYRALD